MMSTFTVAIIKLLKLTFVVVAFYKAWIKHLFFKSNKIYTESVIEKNSGNELV